jgi:hypothetical protein
MRFRKKNVAKLQIGDPVGRPGILCGVQRHLEDHGVTTDAVVVRLSRTIEFSGMLSRSNSHVSATIAFSDHSGCTHQITCLRQPGVKVGDEITISFCPYHPTKIFELSR